MNVTSSNLLRTFLDQAAELGIEPEVQVRAPGHAERPFQAKPITDSGVIDHSGTHL